MAKAQVLVTLTAEVVVDVPADVDVEAFLRKRVRLAWDDGAVLETVAEPYASFTWFPVDEPAPIESADAPAPIELAAQQASEPEPAEGPLDAAARTIGATLGSISAVVTEIAGSLAGGNEAASAEHEAPAPMAMESAALAGDAAHASADAIPVTADLVSAPSVAEPALTRDELMNLFTDPLYKDMVREAVRERATQLLEGVVAEVFSELEPLLRRQLERRSA